MPKKLKTAIIIAVLIAVGLVAANLLTDGLVFSYIEFIRLTLSGAPAEEAAVYNPATAWQYAD
jgi:hypothetical protein